MYQPYPSAGQGPMQPRPAPPAPVLNAVKLMYVGAGLSAIEFIVALATIGSLKSAIRTADPSLTTTQVSTAVTVALLGVGFFGLLGIGLWLWMAWANRAGRSWARIVATVFFGIDTLGLVSLIQPHTIFGTLLTVLVWLAGLGAIVLLWNRESSAYIQAMSARPR